MDRFSGVEAYDVADGAVEILGNSAAHALDAEGFGAMMAGRANGHGLGFPAPPDAGQQDRQAVPVPRDDAGDTVVGVLAQR